MVHAMKHDSADFSHSEPDVEAEADRRLEALLATVPPCPGLPSTDEEIAAADARARADLAAGRCYDHDIVAEWLQTWDQPGRLPFKMWLNARNA